MPNPSEPLPDGLTWITGGLAGKGAFTKAVLKAALKNPRFDIVVCGHVNLLPLAALLGRLLMVPVILEIYGIDAWQRTGNRLVDFLAARVDAVVSISEVTMERFRSWTGFPPEKGFILPNAVHAERYGTGPRNSALMKRYGLEGKTVLMTFGRLVSHDRNKGFDETLEAIPELVATVPDLAYLIAGDGSDRGRLEEKAHRLGIADRVVFSGYVPESEKADHYRLADAYVMPSSGEGFGFVFLEAMACGIPVVASRTDGSREAVRDGQLGILVDPANPSEVKEGILRALASGRGAVPGGLDYFSFDHFRARLHKILDTLVPAP